MWCRYGYLLRSRVSGAEGRRHGVPNYSGVSQAEVWPVVDEMYWTNANELPPDVRAAFTEIEQDPEDFLFLRVTRSSKALWRIATFIRAAVSALDALAIEIDIDAPLPPCDDLHVKWLGYEPYARGEWGLLSLLDTSEALGRWVGQVNESGLLTSPEQCLSFAAYYRKTMGQTGGPEPIADDAIIDILHVGLVPLRAVQGLVPRHDR